MICRKSKNLEIFKQIGIETEIAMEPEKQEQWQTQANQGQSKNEISIKNKRFQLLSTYSYKFLCSFINSVFHKVLPKKKRSRELRATDFGGHTKHNIFW